MDINVFKGMILGMENMGAKFVHCDGFDILFYIEKESEIDNKQRLIIARDSWKEFYGLTLKIKRV